MNLPNGHRLAEATKRQQSAHTRQNGPTRHQDSGGHGHGKLETKGPTQWTSRGCATSEIAEELYQMH